MAKKIGLGRTDWCMSRALTRRNYRLRRWSGPLPLAAFVTYSADGPVPRASRRSSPDEQPTLGIPVDRRPLRRPRRGHTIAFDGYAGAAQLRGSTGQPAARPAAWHARPEAGQCRGRLDPHPVDVAVEKHGVVDDGLAMQQLRIPDWSPVGCSDDRRPGLVADQRHPLSRSAPRPAGRRATRLHPVSPGGGGAPPRRVADLDI